MREITVHALLEHQELAGVSPARFKVLRWGRRRGKDAFAENVSLIGHGPETDGVPKWKGLIHGLDVVWLAPTIPQAAAMWKNEVEPRFRHREGIEVNKVEKTVTILNPDGTAYATLWVRSAEAIDSIRGIGKKLGGVVLNEAAWMDLESAWRDVIRPTLMDCGGWAIIMSTTNGGPDGHIDEGGTKRSPSFFNLLCEQIQQAQRGPEWEEFYGTARDNPRIRPEEFDALVLEYPADSVTLQQEVYAKLVVGGAGVAFPEWNDDVHVARYSPEDPEHKHLFRWSAGGDWGYTKPGGLWLFATGSERSLCRHEYYFNKRSPYEVGFSWGKQIQRFPKPEWIAIDTPAVADGGPTILEQLQQGMNDAVRKAPPVFVNPPKGAGSRATKKTMLHEALKWRKDDDGKVNPWDMPALQFHPDCPNMIRTLQKLPRDPKKPEDVDTTAEDHCLAPGTPIFTSRGWVPISELAGARVTAYDAETLELHLPEGSLVCTPNHRILTPDGWIEAQDLKRHQTILWWCPQPSRRLPAGSITSAATISSAVGASLAGSGGLSACIARSGRLTTGPFQTPTTFTTSTTIDPITGSRTFNVGPGAPTWVIIPAGIELPNANGPRDPLTPQDHAERVIDLCLASGALTRLGEVTSHGRLSTVYDVGVEHGLHGFVAAGAIAHNCYDGATAWLMSRTPYVERPNTNGHHVDDHPGFAKRYEMEPVEIGEGEVKWSRLPPGYEEDATW